MPTAYSFGDVPGYRLGRELGVGGYATVFETAHDGASVAIKVASQPHDRRFADEVLAMREVGSAVAPAVIATGVSSLGHPFIVMERLDGASLAELLADVPLAANDATQLTRAIARTLSAVHAASWVHADVGAANVWVENPDAPICDWSIRLIDFGLAKRSGTSTDDEKEGAGTPLYMAPEQRRGDALAAASADVYSFGVLVFQLFAGRPPFEGSAEATVSAQHASQRPPRLSQHCPTAPADVVALVASCLRKSPTDRPNRLDDVLQGKLEEVSPEPARESQAAEPTSDGSVTRALLALHGSLEARSIAESASSAGGVLAHLSTDLAVFAFDADSEAASLRAAIAFARREATDDVAAVLELAEVRFRKRGDRHIVRGQALRSVSTWLPLPSTGTVRLSEAAGEATSRGLAEVRPLPGGGYQLTSQHRSAGTDRDEPALRGRGQLLGQITAAIADSLGLGRPMLTTIVGDLGVGKTRLLDELEANLVNADGSFRILPLDGAGGRGAEADFLHAVLPDGEPGPALGFRLGKRTETDVETLLASPGLMRHALAAEIAACLTRSAESRPLVVVIDNVDRLDHALLDALELATLAEAAEPVSVIASCGEAFLSARETWGARAGDATTHRLEPLSRDDSIELARDLLTPAEYVPVEILERLWTLSTGVPLFLTELASSIRLGGALRQQDGTGTWYVQPAALIAASKSAVGAGAAAVFAHLAARAAARVPSTFVPALEVAVIVGDRLSEGAVSRFFDRAEMAGVEVGEIDAGVALAALSRTGVLRAAGNGEFEFRHPLLRRALENELDRDRRRTLHRIGLELHETTERANSRVARARHAVGAGESALAAALHLEQGLAATAQHRYLEAEEHLSDAIEHGQEPSRSQTNGTSDPSILERALAARGHIRHIGYREHDALDDLGRAATLAAERGDDAVVADLLLTEADVADCMMDWDAQRDCLERAQPLLATVTDPRVQVRATLRKAVVAYRGQKLDAARPDLERAIEIARDLGELETQTIALLVLATLLTYLGETEASQERFAELIDLCEVTGDRKTLGFAFSNRCELWSCLGDDVRARSDATRAVAIAREIGNPLSERVAQHNLAELLYFAGDYDEALTRAQRSREIEERFFRDWSPADPLLLALIWAAKGDVAEAQRWIAWATRNCAEGTWLPAQRLIRSILHATLSADKPSVEVLGALRKQVSVDAQNDAQAQALLALLSES